MYTPEIVPCDYRRAYDKNGIEIGFWVTVHFIFDGFNAYAFLHSSDSFDNTALAIECGVYVDRWTRVILVTPSVFSNIYQMFLDYENKCATTHI